MISTERSGPEAVVPAEPGERPKTLLCCSAALTLLTVPASAQNKEPTIQPNELAASATQKPPLQLSDKQRSQFRRRW